MSDLSRLLGEMSWSPPSVEEEALEGSWMLPVIGAQKDWEMAVDLGALALGAGGATAAIRGGMKPALAVAREVAPFSDVLYKKGAKGVGKLGEMLGGRKPTSAYPGPVRQTTTPLRETGLVKAQPRMDLPWGDKLPTEIWEPSAVVAREALEGIPLGERLLPSGAKHFEMPPSSVLKEPKRLAAPGKVELPHAGGGYPRAWGKLKIPGEAYEAPLGKLPKKIPEKEISTEGIKRLFEESKPITSKGKMLKKRSALKGKK